MNLTAKDDSSANDLSFITGLADLSSNILEKEQRKLLPSLAQPIKNNESISNLLEFNNDDDQIYVTYGKLKSYYNSHKKDKKSFNTIASQNHNVLLTENDKYFGINAKAKFYNRYNWIADQCNKSLFENGQIKVDLRFDNEISDDRMFNLNNVKLSPIVHGSIKSRDSKLSYPKQVVNRPKNSLDPIVPPLTPRSKYIASCVQDHLYPISSLIIRKTQSYVLDIKHLSIGDNMAQHFANSLAELPCLESLSILDNRLTDKGLVPIIKAVTRVSKLKELNLSHNVIGPKAAEELSIYLCQSNCQLEKLYLQQADVDDFECKKMIETLKRNKSLIEIDLSNNKIGTIESVNNSIEGGNKTGSEAIAEYLSDPSCRLVGLKLNWNMIRKQGGMALASSLSYNKSLTYLDISYNSIGRDGSIVLSQSIQSNKSLRTLLLSNNSIDYIGCFSLVAGILENKSLRVVSLDGNPIGELGAKAAMLIPVLAGNRVKISLNKCIINITETFDCHYEPHFDLNNLLGNYSLDLSKGYERAISIILLYVIAGHPTYTLSSISYQSEESTKPIQDLEFTQILSNERVEFFDDRQKLSLQQLENLKKAYVDNEYAVNLFNEIDADNSGMIDKNELAILMKSFGVELIGQRLNEVMETYDVNGEGLIDLFGFMALLQIQYSDAFYRLQDLTGMPVLALSKQSKGNNLDQLVRYIPPTYGKLNFSVVDTFLSKPYERIITDCDKEYIFEVAKNVVRDSITLMSYGINYSKLRLDEALAMYSIFHKESGEVSRIVCNLLPQLYDAETVRQFLKHAIKNRTDLINIKKELGLYLRPIMGSPNGYYELDLSKINDRACFQRLLVLSNSRREEIKKSFNYANMGHLKDTSQHGNYSCFRNECYNNCSIVIDDDFINPAVPTRGKLEFDFFIGKRPQIEDIKLSDKKFLQLLVKAQIIQSKHTNKYYQRLKKYSIYSQRVYNSYNNNLSNEDVSYSVYECNRDDVKAITLEKQSFYDNINQRGKIGPNENVIEKVPKLNKRGSSMSVPSNPGALRQSNSKSKKSISISKQFNGIGIMTNLSEDSNESTEGITSPILEVESTSSINEFINNAYENHKNQSNGEDMASILEAVSRYQISVKMNGQGRRKSSVVSNDVSSDDDNEENFIEFKNNHQKRRSSYFKIRKSFISKIEVDENYLNEFQTIQQSENVSIGTKSKKMVDLYLEIFNWTWLYSRQLSIILETFVTLGSFNYSKYFGNYRVDLFVGLCDRVIDFNNITLVFKVLTPYEIACIYCRVGILNLFNPLSPYGSWDLDLSKYEERKVVKMIVSMGEKEGYHKIVDREFLMDDHATVLLSNISDGNLSVWNSQENFPKNGFVIFTVLAPTKKKAFTIDMNFRKSLLHLVLLDENDIEDEKSNTRRPSLITSSISSPLSPKRLSPKMSKSVGKVNLQDNLGLWTTYLSLP